MVYRNKLCNYEQIKYVFRYYVLSITCVNIKHYLAEYIRRIYEIKSKFM